MAVDVYSLMVDEVMTSVVAHADYKALEELRASDRLCLTDAVELLQGENYVLKRDLAELTAELAECRRDAERYRWLREKNSLPSSKSAFAVIIDDDDGGVWVGSDLDAAIDNAIARTKA